MINACTYTWSYTWDNNNASWSIRTATAPTFSDFKTATGYKAATFGGKSTGTNTGEYTGVTGITLDPSHTP